MLVVREFVCSSYRVWLRYELFRGKMTKQSNETSEANLQQFLKARNNAVPLTIKTIEYDLSAVQNQPVTA